MGSTARRRCSVCVRVELSGRATLGSVPAAESTTAMYAMRRVVGVCAKESMALSTPSSGLHVTRPRSHSEDDTGRRPDAARTHSVRTRPPRRVDHPRRLVGVSRNASDSATSIAKARELPKPRRVVSSRSRRVGVRSNNLSECWLMRNATPGCGRTLSRSSRSAGPCWGGPCEAWRTNWPTVDALAQVRVAQANGSAYDGLVFRTIAAALIEHPDQPHALLIARPSTLRLSTGCWLR
jgi:hypothetical protein